MVDLYDLIRNIQKRPAMYLGRVSISNLRTFLAGYCFARRQMEIPQTQQEQQFSEFQTWIQQKFNLNSHQTWDQIILFFSQDEPTALEQFFKLFDEFTQQFESEFSINATVAEEALN
ncbi:hypothetical protein H6G76_15645 [Nostoc sp. FACHB-152]|uniref:hypothetical protein n=1 Tax=unclassified Nostoc TaxID=2593658 RepID=UPI0016852837|nr:MULTISPECIES: hypothetical protein [unclassified Nostoc]MBD2448561.1 hypothetical protein [Nostoc sp. FACHB-152]MBD2469971.1 hypothetical protein [Nostoc sp. FACHB-145]